MTNNRNKFKTLKLVQHLKALTSNSSIPQIAFSPAIWGKRIGRSPKFGLIAIAVLGIAAIAEASIALKQLSSDPFTNASSQHKTQVEPDTFAYGKTIVAAFQSGRFFDGGSSGIGWATSKDGGTTWKRGFLPGITKYKGRGAFERVTDPSVAYDARHRVWLISSLGFNEAPTPPGTVVVSRSQDGLVWTKPVSVGGGTFADKNWTVCDNSASSPFYGNCYTEWDDNGLGNRIKMSTSRDGGQTWSKAIDTAGQGTGLGGQPLVNQKGRVIVPIANATETAIAYFESTNGGVSWSAVKTVTPIRSHIVGGNLRSGGLPSAEIDQKGRVYVVWHDCRFRTSCSSNDIVMSIFNNGVWSPVKRIPIDGVNSGVDHFIPGIAVDPQSGVTQPARIVLTYYYYPVANCSTNCKLYAGTVSSTDGGNSWSTPTQLAGPMSLSWLPNTSQGRMVGDYISGSFVGRKVFPAIAVAKVPLGGTFNQAIYTTTPGLVPVAGKVRVQADPVRAEVGDRKAAIQRTTR
ncbi:MAG TPA: sialidase family protein [Stenomitos sp.]